MTEPVVRGNPNLAWPVTPARLVVTEHAALHDRMAHPDLSQATYIEGFARDVYEKMGRDENEAGMMFYPVKAWMGLPYARMWAGEVARSLFQARTFQVTADMIDAVTALYQKGKGLFHVEEPELPAPHGFLWLDKPLDITDRQGKQMTERAYSWGLTTIQGRMDIGGVVQPVEPMPAIRLCSWNSPDDPDWYLDEYPETRPVMEMLGKLVMSHVLIVPFGERHEHYAGRIEDAGLGFPADSGLAWLHYLWMFMDTEVPALKRQKIHNKAAQRRLRKSILHGEVTTVMLRRSHSAGLDDWEGDGSGTDWTCRWIVQGHDRHLESYSALGYQKHHALRGAISEDGDPACVTCGTRITWVRAYLKGPDGLPIRSSQRVYRVSR